jgi:outer membrane lipoprotein-sorting protein
MKARILFSLGVLLALISSTSARGDDRIIEAIIAGQNRIKTIDCTLSQLIYESGTSASYLGRFRADSKGRFRIDYTQPSRQTVLNTSNGLFWHMPESNTVFIIPSKGPSMSGPAARSIGSVIKKIESNMDFKYLGVHMYGFFTTVHRFIMIDKKIGTKIEIIAGARDNIVLEKKVLDRDGYEVMREIYSDYTMVDGIHFPLRVDVYARTENGVTRSISRYRDIVLNGAIDDGVFRLKIPKNARKMTYGTR